MAKKTSKAKPSNAKKMGIWSLALMGFTCVWGFGNVANGFGYFGGLQVVLPWILVFVLYFCPYALMVGELGATFKDKAGGVSSWVQETIGPKVAFFCGWIYWVVHMPYMANKASNMIVAANWAGFQNGNYKGSIAQINDALVQANPAAFGSLNLSGFEVPIVQIIGLIIFLVCVFLCTRGLGVIKIISSIAGTASFAMGLLYILMVFTAPAINPNVNLAPVSFDIQNFIPDDWSAILNLSILILAVGGCEKISPYVNQMKNAKRDFPLGMIFLLVMVMICALLGTFAMGMMFDVTNIPADQVEAYYKDFITNGQYYAFQELGGYYNCGNTFVVIYAITRFATEFAVLIISLDAPLRIMLGNADKKSIPAVLFKQNKNGSYTNGVLLEMIIVSILILIPCIGIGDVQSLIKWLIKLNSVCMPLRYLFVFAAYIGLKRAMGKFKNDGYIFTKSKGFGMFVGGWCFFVTLMSCLMGMYTEDVFQLIANILTPVVLLGLGFIMPALAKRSNKKLAKK